MKITGYKIITWLLGLLYIIGIIYLEIIAYNHGLHTKDENPLINIFILTLVIVWFTGLLCLAGIWEEERKFIFKYPLIFFRYLDRLLKKEF